MRDNPYRTGDEDFRPMDNLIDMVDQFASEGDRMDNIERDMTPEEIRALDPVTRQLRLDIRKSLGIK